MGLLAMHTDFIVPSMIISCRNGYAFCCKIFLCRVVIDAAVPHIKMVSEQFDRCHGTLLQYVEFLSGAVTPTSAYALLVPTLNELVHLYHLDPEVFPVGFSFYTSIQSV